jgi:hypothetical protein
MEYRTWMQTTSDSSAAYDLVDVPTVAQYKAAFLACRPALKSERGWSWPLEMLKASYYAPDHTISPGDLARAVGLASYSAANLRYATYAKALCAELGRDPKFKVAILAKFSGGVPNSEQVQWTMLPQVAEALEALGWVRRDRLKA